MISIKRSLYIFFLSLLVLSFQTYAFVRAEEGITKPKLERHFVFDTIPLNLEEITKDADRIFFGKCISIEEIEDDLESKLPVFEYTFKTIEGIKGVDNEQIVIFKQWQPTVRTTGYEEDKKYVLFLYPNSERGLTSPVGFEQGLFDIETKGIIRKDVVRNRANNRGLNRNLRTQKRVVINEDKYINDYIENCSELGTPMRYQEFVKAVKYLVKRQK